MAQQEFTSPLLAPDLQRKKFELERAAQMGRALMDQGSEIPQGQMVSGHYVAPSWTQYLSQGLKSYLGGRTMNSIPDRMADLQKTQQDYTLSGFGFKASPQQLGQALSGGSAQAFPVGPSGTPQQPAVQDTTQQPMLLPGMNEAQSRNMLLTMGPGAYAAAFARATAASQPKTPEGYNRMPNGELQIDPGFFRAKVQLAAASRPVTNVSVNTAPKAFWGDFGKQASDQLFKEREGAQAAASTMQSIGELRQAAENGAFQGAGADLKLGAARALRSLGADISEDQVANSELFSAVANGFVLDRIKMLGANPSNADRAFIEKTVPRLSTDPAALPSLLDFMEKKARGQVNSFNSKIKEVQKQPGAEFLPYSLEVAAPEVKRSPAGNGYSTLWGE